LQRFKKSSLSLAEVVELVDTLDSKSSASDSVRVRVPPSVQKKALNFFGAFFILSLRNYLV
jgi:hypothetical protein